MLLTTSIIFRLIPPPGAPAGGKGRILSSVIFLWLSIALIATAVPGLAATLPGTPITNTATAEYGFLRQGRLAAISNLHTLVVKALLTPATLDFLRYEAASPTATPTVVAPSLFSTSGTIQGPFMTLTPPLSYPGLEPIDLGQPIDLVPSINFLTGEPLFLQLTDLDQNLFNNQIDTIFITVVGSTGDKEALTLHETGENTGIFTGYLQTAREQGNSGDGRLNVTRNGTVTVTYQDQDDASDVFSLEGLFDPEGIVFDSMSGEPVDGATVTLVDMVTGLPADVFGDDGISKFPPSVISGGTVTDSSGTVYQFDPGHYRFPQMSTGRYRLDITPPSGYTVPSKVSADDLQKLPGAPWDIMEDASRGEEFILDPVPILRVDIPIDPTPSILWLEKKASKEVVGIGDFVAYEIKISNTSEAAGYEVILTDQLPLGFRYQSGSARIDGQVTANPTLSPDGRTLIFALGTLGSGQSHRIGYVVEVAAGARTGKAINRATATARGVTSNEARATVKVRDDFMRDKSFVAGRVLTGDCSRPDEELAGVPDIKIYLEDGTYVITDKEGGYHFEGLQPGTHILQLDLETFAGRFEEQLCEPSPRFADIGSSQFIDLQPGTLWRADFHLRAIPAETAAAATEKAVSPARSVHLGMQSQLGENRLVTLRLPISAEKSTVDNVRLSVILPPGSEYISGSSRFDEAPLADPDAMMSVLNYRLGDLPADVPRAVTLDLRLTESIKGDEIPFRAMLTVDSGERKNLRTAPIVNTLKREENRTRLKLPDITLRPEFFPFAAELSTADRQHIDELMENLPGCNIIQAIITGHTDNIPVPPRQRHRFGDNQALSLARANAVATYLRERLGLPVEAMLVSGAGATKPLANNSTEAGRARNRRVDLRLVCEKVEVRSEIVPGIVAAEGEPVDIAPSPATEPLAAKSIDNLSPKELQTRIFADDYLAETQSGYEWVWPPANFYPEIPSLKVGIKHDPAQRVRLLLNGQAVDPLNFEGTRHNAGRTIAFSHWNGIDIIDGDNRLRVELLDREGNVVQSEDRIVHYSLSPVTAILLPEQSQLIADGVVPPVLAIKLLDREGHPARAGVIGDFLVSSPHVADKSHFANPDLGEPDRPGEKTRFIVGENGIARLALAPISRSGEAEVVLKLANGDEKVTAWLNPKLRDWILVGLAEGTVGYNSVSGNMENLATADQKEDFFEDGRIAFFAKGKIKGSWLLTMAYDSDREREDSLHQIIDPDTYYTVYGDGSQQQYEAASQRKLYLKIERDRFYALFGDYTTGLTVTELSRYSRSLNGFKSELQSENLAWNIFGSETNQAFVKDEIPGDGTSGLYRLSRRDIVLNSEKIVIEVRDRFHSETILSSRPLIRHLDYDIDYDLGTLFFKEPIPSRDSGFNPIFVVVDYEAQDSGDRNFNYGGRAAVRILDRRLEVGASAIHEGQTGAIGDLFGADATVKITPETTVRGEIAKTDVEEAEADNREGQAWLAEVTHLSKFLQGRLYAREQEADFGLGQQAASEEGMRKIGAEAAYTLTDHFVFEGEASRETNLQTDAERDLTEMATVYKQSDYSLRFGLRQTIENLADDSSSRSLQGLLGGNWQATSRINLRLDHDQSLGDNESADYPTRTQLGIDYRLTDAISLFAEQEWTRNDLEDSEMTRAGLKTTPWNGAQANSSVEQTIGENGTRVIGNLGLRQTWQLTKKLAIDAGLDRSQTLRHPGTSEINPEATPASGGGEDFTAISTGANWHETIWSWDNRLEYRTADTETKWNLLSSAIGEVRQGVALSGKVQLNLTDAETGADTTKGDIRLGAAWRPAISRWIILERLDYLFDRQNGGTTDSNSWRLVNSLHANYKPNRRTQVALQYGLKYVQENIDSDSYDGYTDVAGLETRYDLTRIWDLGLHGNALHSWHSGQIDYRSGASVGCNVMKNAWISVGYNITGFEDEDFSRADFTAKGPFIKFRMKFDQNSVRDTLAKF